MQLHPQSQFLHNPTAASVSTDANFPGEVYINTDTGRILVAAASSINACSLDCAAPCIPQQFTVNFPDAVYGDCNACNFRVGFTIRRDRSPDYDVADYLYVTNTLELDYPHPGVAGTVNGTTIATYFKNLINNAQSQADIHDYWGITATSSGATLTLVVPCHITVQLFPLQNPGAYTVTIANTVVGQQAKWTVPQMKRMFQKDVNQIPGQDLDVSYFSNCESVCVLYIQGCYAPCVNIPYNKDNAVHLHEVGTKQAFIVFINSNAPGYAAFITALASAVSACSSLTALQGSSTAFDSAPAATWATGVNVDDSGFTFPGTFQITNGSVSLTVTAASYAALAAAITGDATTSVTAAYATPNMTVTGMGTGVITLRQLS